MTGRSRHDELRARAEDVQRQFDSGGPLQAPPAHLVAAWPYEVLALLDEVAAAEARAEKAEQALRELVTATTTWDDDLSSYCDGDDRTRVREALVAARAALAAAAGDTGDTE